MSLLPSPIVVSTTTITGIFPPEILFVLALLILLLVIDVGIVGASFCEKEGGDDDDDDDDSLSSSVDGVTNKAVAVTVDA